ncbi:Sua5/YciO/YrdC/YwlC family protein [Spirosoma sp. SC4-14]|uniref:L-threonylcarbamoyladenylate synthase n=1 Tax=Spirosoma sp. SC4-14 TaxID=3128900 RepID=UPI0030CFAD4C
MTSSIRDITYQLRQGQLIALADETGWSLVADPTNNAAVQQLLSFRASMPAGQYPTVIIQSADQLVLYVATLPDIAYDVVEFAENPLTIVYDQGKNVSSELLASSNTPETLGELAVRRALNPDVQQLIGGFGRGLLSIPFESLTLPPAAKAASKGQFGTLPGMPRRPRIMRLGIGGEVNFIRK